jgi:hypothetical protein
MANNTKIKMRWKLYHKYSGKVIGYFEKTDSAQRFIDKHYGGSKAFEIEKVVDEILDKFK